MTSFSYASSSSLLYIDSGEIDRIDGIDGTQVIIYYYYIVACYNISITFLCILLQNHYSYRQGWK